MLSFKPVLVTAALVTLLFFWLRLLSSPEVALLLTLAGAFGTMLWPYAYISMEPLQSLFVLLAGFLGLACGPIRGWWRMLAFAAVCGIAVSLKSTGLVFFPAIGYLLYVQFRDDWRSRPCPNPALAAVIGASGSSRWWPDSLLDPARRRLSSTRPWIIDSPFTFFTNVIGMLGSPSQGPVRVLPGPDRVSLRRSQSVPHPPRHYPLRALLVSGAIIGELSMLKAFADEVWGSRYLHTAIAPLLLVMGAAFPRWECAGIFRSRRWRPSAW